MDAGGLAQMTYNNNFQPNGGIGLPSAGFASRGKGAALKRLNLATPPKVGSIAENSVECPTPRTSRSHLLAGLRTAPKTPTSAQPPASAPYHQAQHALSLNQSRYARGSMNGLNQGVPQTAIGSGFGGAVHTPLGQQQMLYSGPDQVLAPPSLQYEDGELDPNVAAQLLATELFLAQRQQELQQQLLQLTAQQFGGMNLNGGMRQSQSFASAPFTPQLNNYGQQFQNAQAVQPTSQPGVYLVYNQLTGQYNYAVDPNFRQTQQTVNDIQQQMVESNLSHSPPPPTPRFANSPPKSATPTVQVSPPNEVSPSPWGSRSSSPPKKASTPPQDVVPLPPPSANAFRRGHKKTVSSLALDGTVGTPDGPKSAFVRPVGFPQTPMTGTFGPGQGRAGEHPVRQPRGPPPLEELQVSPTTKHEGSKNFATRQRRKAVNSLVRAGIGRRGVRSGSNGSMTPVSETEMSFPASDNESVHSAGSGSLSGKPSIGSLRAAANGAIGSERKASKERLRERTPTGGSYTANSVSSDEGIGGGLVEIRPQEPQRRKMPMLVLTSAEKRKSSMF
ncbi:hypothetical protein M011DRAFT_478240 [Sporormia fimetaria CBS 119925]|uniref:Uncharacterized protein n=1 Tax=Sporormia fimetaria CBS 119925 TaxID=1340428 RepID=A0A6A6V934_9PLEO|nr:hypothetical protein M011DRAFT_478240 [Sporormia fimetaria CBS 119925]